MELSGAGKATLTCAHKRCKRGGVKPIHVFDLRSGILLESIYRNAGFPSEILGYENNEMGEYPIEE